MEDVFNTLPEIAAPPVSPLFAMGTSGPRFPRGWLIGIGVVAALFISLIIFTLLCSGTFFLPKNTIVFVSGSPKTLNALLTREQKQTLPNEWQETLQTNSRWPVVFGLAGSRAEVHAFTLGPRWAVPAPLLQTANIDTRAVIREVSAQTEPSSESIVYRELFFDHLFAKGSLNGWLNGSLLFPSTSSSERVAFAFQQGTIVFLNGTTDKTKDMVVSNTLSLPLQVDLSLQLSALEKETDVETFLSQLSLTPIQTTLTSLSEPPASIDVRFASSSLESLRLTFAHPLQPAEQATLLSALNKTYTKQLLTLPDGTVVVEYLASSPSNSLETSNSNPTTLTWLVSSTTSPLTEAKACGRGTWLARFSPQLLARLIPSESLLNTWLPTHAVQVWRDTKQNLVICLER